MTGRRSRTQLGQGSTHLPVLSQAPGPWPPTLWTHIPFISPHLVLLALTPGPQVPRRCGLRPWTLLLSLCSLLDMLPSRVLTLLLAHLTPASASQEPAQPPTRCHGPTSGSGVAPGLTSPKLQLVWPPPGLYIGASGSCLT